MMRKCLALLSAFVLGASTSFAHTLTVPFFKDDGTASGNGSISEGSLGFISISNTTDNTITMNIVYIQQDLNGDSVVQEAAEFQLVPRAAISWRPVGDDVSEGTGRGVPNVLSGFGASGSAEIIWLASEGGPGALVGRYTERSNAGNFAHVLVLE